MMIFFAFRFFKLITNYKSKSRPDLNDLKNKAEHLKNKYKNVEEADFRDISTSDNESESAKQ